LFTVQYVVVQASMYFCMPSVNGDNSFFGR
jgi:hypothetical protein